MLHEIPSIVLDGRRIGADVPPFVIAEIGLNHGGSLTHATLMLTDATLLSYMPSFTE